MLLLEVLQNILLAPGDPTLPPGPVDIPGYEIPRDSPSKGLDIAENYGPAFGVFLAAGILIFVARKIIAAIPWKIVGPVLIFILAVVYVTR